MEVLKNKIDLQIAKIKKMIDDGSSKDDIMAEKEILDELLKEYLKDM